MIGMFLIVWSIRLSLVLLVVTFLAWLLTRGQAQSHWAIRVTWTFSFLLFLVHVLSSFHFIHHWSHREAYAATAKETARLMGVEFGGGVYFNYLFLAGWALHVWFTWFPAAARGPVVRTFLQLILLYMLFIAFNGVVVFKSGWLRALGISATIAIAVTAIWSMMPTRSALTKNCRTQN